MNVDHNKEDLLRQLTEGAEEVKAKAKVTKKWGIYMDIQQYRNIIEYAYREAERWT